MNNTPITYGLLINTKSYVYGLLAHVVNIMFKVNGCSQKSNEITNLQEIVQCYIKGLQKSL
jgi:hypothetical protein